MLERSRWGDREEEAVPLPALSTMSGVLWWGLACEINPSSCCRGPSCQELIRQEVPMPNLARGQPASPQHLTFSLIPLAK